MICSDSETEKVSESEICLSQNSESTKTTSALTDEIVINEAAILKVINNLREEMNLTLLKRNRTLKRYASAIANKESKTLNFGNDNYSIISFSALSNEYPYMSPDELVKKWIYNSQQRSIILAPGNYGAINIERLKDNRCIITFVIAFIFRNE